MAETFNLWKFLVKNFCYVEAMEPYLPNFPVFTDKSAICAQDLLWTSLFLL
ncbi:hypothetical protein VP01_2550g2 [Puccinia sorghi]|uniref:Uncharacterized protein n=1 Tax=Puccinia sorghi TaxID=27349 RepID=A0A0L6V716_9BASI|nr:hypothetical protein VP01_2550g2 [Puccinia sorghi]